MKLSRVGKRFHFVALGVGGLLYVGFELALLAHDFLLLQLDLLLLLDDRDLNFFSLYELAGFILLQIVSEVGLGFFQVHRRLETRDTHLVIALGFGDLCIGDKFGFLAGLLCLGGFDHRVAIGFSLGDDRIPLHLGDTGFSQRVEVALAVPDIADRETDDSKTHVGHVASRDFLDFRGKGVAILVNLLDGHCSENGAEMAFKGLHGDILDIVCAFAQKLFGCRGDGYIVTFDFDLGHAINLHGHTFTSVNFRSLHIYGHQLQP